MADRDQFSPEELAVVLSHYDLGVITSVTPFNRGTPDSPKVGIVCDRGKYLFKRRSPDKNRLSKVAFVHELLESLHAHGLPVPPLKKTRTGPTLLHLQHEVYEMFEFVSGQHFDQSEDQAYRAGELLAQYHKEVESFDAEGASRRHGYHNARGVRSGLNRIPSSVQSHDSVVGKEAELLGLIQYLYETYENACEAVEAQGIAEWPELVAHSDWHPGNLLFRHGKIVAVFDFDGARTAPRATDLANGMMQFSITTGGRRPADWPADFDERRIRAFLSGYEAVDPLPPEQMHVLPQLMIEALIAETAMPIATTGSFGRHQGLGVMRMVRGKIGWLQTHCQRVIETQPASPKNASIPPSAQL